MEYIIIILLIINLVFLLAETGAAGAGNQSLARRAGGSLV